MGRKIGLLFIVLLFLILQPCHRAEARRLKVGLVLSGGGARGAAHLGVIKMFERHHIPIDAIVGTSMGAFIGGLYAAGQSSRQIEELLKSQPWREIIGRSYVRSDIPFRRKTLERDFPSSAKLNINQDNEIVLAPALFKKQGLLDLLKKQTYAVRTIDNFDGLRIPFRSVASRLRDGRTIVLRDGSLAESIYASLAIPGAFEPITIHGDVLVDGGVVDNLPIDVMRKEMDVDVIVAVDISTPYEINKKYDTYLSVANQLVRILMRKNVEASIASMAGRDNEILLTPQLGHYTPLDIDSYAEIIAIGEKAAEAVFSSELATLAIGPDNYADYKNQLVVQRPAAPIIDNIVIDNTTYLNNEKIRSLLHIKAGERFDPQQIEEDLHDIYSLMIFDDVSYRLENGTDGTTLRIVLTPNYDANGQIRFSFGFEDNMKGHSDYFAKFEYIRFGLNSYAGEWRTRIALGQENLFMTELYQPLDPYGKFYLRPQLFYRDRKLYATPGILGNHSIRADLDDSIVMRGKEYGGLLGIGVNISNDLRLETNAVLKRVNPSAQLLILDNNGLILSDEAARASVYAFSAELEFDTLDDPFFPKTGMHITSWLSRSNQFNSSVSGSDDVICNQYFLEYTGAFSRGSHTLIPNIKTGRTFGVEGDFNDTQDFNSFFTLGGLFSLSGLPTNGLTGSNIAFASLVYRYRLSKEDFFGSLTVPLYIGASIETGEAWYGNGDFASEKLLYGGSVYLAADTILGPFYLGFGATEFDYYSIYFSLGKSF